MQNGGSPQANGEFTQKRFKDLLDTLMLPFKKINPTFYGEYLNTRTIVDRATTPTRRLMTKQRKLYQI